MKAQWPDVIAATDCTSQVTRRQPGKLRRLWPPGARHRTPAVGPPRRVLLVIDSLDGGGAERYVLDLAIALRARGWDVEVACSAARVPAGRAHRGAAGGPRSPCPAARDPAQWRAVRRGRLRRAAHPVEGRRCLPARRVARRWCRPGGPLCRHRRWTAPRGAGGAGGRLGTARGEGAVSGLP